MSKGPYGFLYKTEKKRHKDMTLRKEKIADNTKQRGEIILLCL